MNPRKLLRRSVPILALIAVALTLSLPALASSGSSASVLPFTRNGPIDASIPFSPSDFQVEGDASLDAIILSSLPDPQAGFLTLADQTLQPGDVISMSAVSGLRFQPLSTPTLAHTSFSFLPVFSSGPSEEAVEVGLYLLSGENGAPVAQDLELSTYKNVPLTAQFAATDPEGDALTFQLIKKPSRGAVTMPADGSTEFVYTPYENKTGKDSFTYVAVDAVGNTSEPATVKLRIEKASTKVTYSDMEGVSAYKAAIRLAEEGIFVGEQMGENYFFCPDRTVSRSEFTAMAMKAVGIDALPDVSVTGFADDTAIPTWAKGYAASALKSGVVLGTVGEDGQVVFSPDSPITRAEAAVVLDRALQVSDVAQTMLPEAAPTWCAQSAANLSSCGVLSADASGSLGLTATITRADAAEMLLGALEVLDSRDTGGWFHW